MHTKARLKIGIVVNPYAGIGGALALKGSDGYDVRAQALNAGAQCLANDKMRNALKLAVKELQQVQIFTASGSMGEYTLTALGLTPSIVYSQTHAQSEASDTESAIVAMLAENIDVLIFAGGDGTARNVFHCVGQTIPVLGVPAGCKIHSGVYAVTPSGAGEVLRALLKGEAVSQIEGEVRDIDESAFRQGKVIAKHYGSMRVPSHLNYVQAVKMGGQESDELVLQDMVDDVIEIMDEEDDFYYVMGSGSTLASVMASLNLPNSLLGVDVVYQSECIKSDVDASYLEQLVNTHKNKVKLVITVIGGQGHIFGRGNQQLSPCFLKQIGKQNILILASKLKLNSLEGRPLRVDTGNESVDRNLRGPITIITGYHDRALYLVE